MSNNTQNRRNLLKQYIIACLCDSSVSFADLLTPHTAIQKISAVAAKDIPLVIADVKREGLSGALSAGAEYLRSLADVMKAKSK